MAEHSAYHHGETSLASTIVGMAQDFVGANNINLLVPSGQFGTRLQGGKDAASARYIYTHLNTLTRHLFNEADDALLSYQVEEGQGIEPEWCAMHFFLCLGGADARLCVVFLHHRHSTECGIQTPILFPSPIACATHPTGRRYMPILPMVLVNGAEGIGTGWSTSIPNYNPRDIVANLKRLLAGQEQEPMAPWYRGFRGVITEVRAPGIPAVLYISLAQLLLMAMHICMCSKYLLYCELGGSLGELGLR